MWVLHGDAPQYLGPFSTPLLLMSLVDGRCVLPEPIAGCVVPPVRVSTVGSRAFPVAAAQIWNSLPEHIISGSQLLRCSPSGVTWKRFYCNNLSAYSTLVDLVVTLVTLATLNKWFIDWLSGQQYTWLLTCHEILELDSVTRRPTTFFILTSVWALQNVLFHVKAVIDDKAQQAWAAQHSCSKWLQSRESCDRRVNRS